VWKKTNLQKGESQKRQKKLFYGLAFRTMNSKSFMKKKKRKNSVYQKN